jgi:hypothetical protein
MRRRRGEERLRCTLEVFLVAVFLVDVARGFTVEDLAGACWPSAVPMEIARRRMALRCLLKSTALIIVYCKSELKAKLFSSGVTAENLVP